MPGRLNIPRLQYPGSANTKSGTQHLMDQQRLRGMQTQQDRERKLNLLAENYFNTGGTPEGFQDELNRSGFARLGMQYGAGLPERFGEPEQMPGGQYGQRSLKSNLMRSMGGGQQAKYKTFQPIAIINPKTQEKRLVSPTANPRTGEVSLNRYDIPPGFKISTETPQEKRAANVLAKGQQKQQEVTSKGKAQREQELISQGLDAADSYANVKRGIELLESVKTGGLDNLKLKGKQLFGIEGANEAELSNRLGKAVLSQLRQTFGAAFTAKEGESLAKIEAGFGKSTEGNKRLLKQTERIILRAAKRGIKAAKRSGDMETAREIQDALDFTLGDGTSNNNPKGWPLMIDAQGNRAYVGPNGEIEEVR